MRNVAIACCLLLLLSAGVKAQNTGGDAPAKAHKGNVVHTRHGPRAGSGGAVQPDYTRYKKGGGTGAGRPQMEYSIGGAGAGKAGARNKATVGGNPTPADQISGPGLKPNPDFVIKGNNHFARRMQRPQRHRADSTKVK